MDSVGAEVGQKMRSAIKAKLLELSCYVDDELPDYIMVMVANRRTKAQMSEDLTLFLNTKTEAFVDWLHIVLKKLKEVTVTNPEVYKRVTKRKSSEQSDIKVKKEKKVKKLNDASPNGSLTDNLPIIPPKKNSLDEAKKEDEFDIPLLSEVHTSNEQDLEEIERKIRSVKSRLGILVDSDVKEINKIEKDESECTNDKTEEICEKHRKHSPITFEMVEKSPKKSVLERLGDRVSDKKKECRNRDDRVTRYSSRDKKESRDERRNRKDKSRHDEKNEKKTRDKFSKTRQGLTESPESKSRNNNKNASSQVGVLSKIYIPDKPAEEPDHADELRTREVRSMVQVKPRVISANTPQPNKNLLLKAVAEANLSVSLASNIKPKTSVEFNGDIPITRKLSHREKVKLRNIILAQVSREDSDSNDGEKEFEYVPKPLTKRSSTELPKYVPSSRQSIDEMEPETVSVKTRISVKARLEGRKSPSPIIFDKALHKKEIPDQLSSVHPPLSLKSKEVCKYWPNCRQGEKCEFVHPATKCELFPNCHYRDKCLYTHPSCKFGSSCTKRDCLYSHFRNQNLPKAPVAPPQVCKFFPKCTNSTCLFYHPKVCRFGKYCKNKSDCPFSHLSKSNLTWRSKV